jgi:hypothetical protein
MEEFLAFGSVDGSVDAEVPGEHTIYVTIDDSSRQSEGDTPYGSSRIVAYALQLSDALDGIGEIAKRNNLSGGKMEISRPTVVAQSLPLAEYFVFRGSSERLHRRPAVHETLPIVPPLFHLRLLEDNLREPDSIRVASLPPGQIATVLAKPV